MSVPKIDRKIAIVDRMAESIRASLGIAWGKPTRAIWYPDMVAALMAAFEREAVIVSLPSEMLQRLAGEIVEVGRDGTEVKPE